VLREWGKMFSVASSTAQESMLEPLLTTQASLLTAQLTKCDGLFPYPKGLVFWNGESSVNAILSKAEEEPIKKEKMSHFIYHKTSTRALWSKAEEELFF